MTTDLGICNTGLYLVGADEINGFDDETREAKISSQLYDTTKKSCLQMHLWNFSLVYAELAKTELSTDSAEYDFGFKYQYQLPVDYLRAVRKNEPTNDYRISRDKLYTNDDEVQLHYQYDVSEGSMPAYFVRYLELEMAKIYAAALLQDETQIEIWSSLSQEALRKAKTIDAQSEPSAQIDPRNFALTSVRDG
jgi:hypothetical protein